MQTREPVTLPVVAVSILLPLQGQSRYLHLLSCSLPPSDKNGIPTWKETEQDEKLFHLDSDRSVLQDKKIRTDALSPCEDAILFIIKYRKPFHLLLTLSGNGMGSPLSILLSR